MHSLCNLFYFISNLCPHSCNIQLGLFSLSSVNCTSTVCSSLNCDAQMQMPPCHFVIPFALAPPSYYHGLNCIRPLTGPLSCLCLLFPTQSNCLVSVVTTLQYVPLAFLSFTGLLSAWSPAQPSIILIAFIMLPWARFYPSFMPVIHCGNFGHSVFGRGCSNRVWTASDRSSDGLF